MKKKLLLAVILAIVVILCRELLRADLSPGPWHLNDRMTVTVDTHQFSTGSAYDATEILCSVYRFDNDNDVNEIITDTPMVKKDGKTGFYSLMWRLTAENGFVGNTNYAVFIAATVDGVSAIKSYGFRITPDVPTLLGFPVSGSIAQDIADVNSIVYNSYQYLTEVNETHITNVATKATLIQSYITEVNDTTHNLYTYITDVNETYITQLITDINNTYTYLVDTNDVLLAEILSILQAVPTTPESTFEAAVAAALLNVGYTDARAGYLDYLTAIYAITDPSENLVSPWTVPHTDPNLVPGTIGYYIINHLKDVGF